MRACGLCAALRLEPAAGLVAIEPAGAHEQIEIVVAEGQGQGDPRRWRQVEDLGDGAPAEVIGLARGKKSHDKRDTLKKRETDRETRAAVKERQR